METPSPKATQTLSSVLLDVKGWPMAPSHSETQRLQTRIATAYNSTCYKEIAAALASALLETLPKETLNRKVLIERTACQ